MKKTYFINNNGQNTGPFLLEEMKNQGISLETAVWTAGFEQWTSIENVPELKALLGTATPPPFNMPVTPPPFTMMTTSTNKPTASVVVKATQTNDLTQIWTNLQPNVRYAVLLLILVVFGKIGYAVWDTQAQRKVAATVVQASAGELKQLKAKLGASQAKLNGLHRRRAQEDSFHFLQFDHDERVARVDTKITAEESTLNQLKNQIEDIEKTIEINTKTAQGE